MKFFIVLLEKMQLSPFVFNLKTPTPIYNNLLIKMFGTIIMSSYI